MAEETEVHPGSFVGDTIEEYKKLPMWGKIVVAGLAIGAVFILYRSMTNRGNQLQQTTLQPTTNTPGSQSPFPSIASGQSSVPLLPSGVNPVYNSQGDLTAFQQAANTTSSTTPSNLFATIRARFSNPQTNSYDQQFAQGIPVRSSPSGSAPSIGDIAYGQKVQLVNTPSVSGQSNFGSSSTNGSNQWYQLASGGYVSGYDVANTSSGGGGRSWRSMIRGLEQYHPQYGDNMTEVANKLGMQGWKSWGVGSFQHNIPLKVTRQ